MDNSDILKAFNNHFIEFVDDIQTVFPDDKDIMTLKTSIQTMRKANPRLLMQIWKNQVIQPYKKEILEGNTKFFIEKDYSQDLGVEQDDSMLKKINQIRESIISMEESNINKSLEYVQNLTKLAELYN